MIGDGRVYQASNTSKSRMQSLPILRPYDSWPVSIVPFLVTMSD